MPIRRSLLAAVLSAAVVLGSVTSGAAGDTAQQTPASAAVLAQLQTILLGQAALHGDPTPTRTLAVATRSHAAEDLVLGSHDGQAPVPAYLLCAKGTFDFDGLSAPHGFHPTGQAPTTLCLVVLAQGLGVTGLSLGQHYPVLRTLGTVQDLNVQPVLSAAVLAQLRTVLLTQAQGTGDPNPTRLRMVATTYGAALSVVAPGQGIDSDTTPVFVLVASGHFRSPFGLPPTPGRPRTAPPPVGTLWVIVPQTGGGLLSDGGSARAPDLGRLGSVQPL
jgi:hypothetical protein